MCTNWCGEYFPLIIFLTIFLTSFFDFFQSFRPQVSQKLFKLLFSTLPISKHFFCFLCSWYEHENSIWECTTYIYAHFQHKNTPQYFLYLRFYFNNIQKNWKKCRKNQPNQQLNRRKKKHKKVQEIYVYTNMKAIRINSFFLYFLHVCYATSSECEMSGVREKFINVIKTLIWIRRFLFLSIPLEMKNRKNRLISVVECFFGCLSVSFAGEKIRLADWIFQV